MVYLSRKFVAVVLALWFPLFSGNALAVSVAMQAMNGDCRTAVTQQVSLPSQHDSVAHQHMHHAQQAGDQDQAAAHQEQPNSSNYQQKSPCNNCGVCQLACSGYLAPVTISVADDEPFSQSFILVSTQFQSVTLALLVPPPLALVLA